MAISPHQHMGLFKHIQNLGYKYPIVPRGPLKSIWQCWVIADSLGHVLRRLALLHLHCLPWRSQVVLHLPLAGWAGWAWCSHPGVDRLWKKTTTTNKIGRSFEKRTYSIYFKMIRSTYAGILNLMNGGDAHTQYGSIASLLTMAHII